MQISKLAQKLTNPISVFILLAAIFCITYLVSKFGFSTGIFFVVIFIVIPTFILIIVNPKAGFLLLFILASFMWYFKRVTAAQLKMGVLIDVFFYPLFLGLIIGLKDKKLSYTSIFKNRIITLIIIWYVFLMLQIVNPFGSIQGWIFGIRVNIRMIVIFISAYLVFEDMKTINQLIKIWFVIAMITALYGLYQELVGFPDYDMKWALSDEKRVKLLFINGYWRVWSIMAGASEYGIFMVTSALFFLAYSFKFKNNLTKTMFITSSLLFAYASVFSGTRTAYAVLIVGIVFILVLNLDKPITILFSGIMIFVMVFILYAPIDNYRLRRFRSTFSPTEDPSYLLREKNKQRMRGYIYTHPLGGGLQTTGAEGVTYNKGHILADFPPDSYYFKYALETGIIGVTLLISIFLSTVIFGIQGYFCEQNYEKKIITLAFTAFFFGLTTVGYSQESVDQYPYGIILYSSIAILINLRTIKS